MSVRAQTPTARSTVTAGGRAVHEVPARPGGPASLRPPQGRPAQGRGPRLVGVLVESFVAVLAVSLFVGVLLGWFGRPPAQGGTPEANRSGLQQGALSRSAPVFVPPTSGPALSTDPGDVLARSASEAARAVERSAATSAGSSTAVPDVPVAVLNSTQIAGLAGRTAAGLREKGWTVPVVDDFIGEVSASTVYYPDGRSDAAGVLAQVLGIDQVRPAPASITEPRLTVVLTGETRLES